MAPPKPKVPGSSEGWSLPKVATSVGLGITFGFCLQKGHVFEPRVIMDQFTFSNFSMLKMFLSAVAASLMAGVVQYFFVSQKAKEKFLLRRLPSSPRSYASTIVGASILGFGMAVGGACPGTVAAQLGSGTGFAAVEVIGGALLGALVYGLLDGKLQPFIQQEPKPSKLKSCADQSLGVTYPTVAVPLAFALAGVVYGLEMFRPWYTDLGYLTPPSALSHMSFFSPRATIALLNAPAWPPYLAGAIIGSSQIVANLALDASLGSSTSYVVTVSNTCGTVCTLPRYLEEKKSSAFKNWWQVLYIGSAIGGSYLAATLGHTFGSVSGLDTVKSVMGGFLILFGSRLANGCTSGHGITGFSQLNLSSFVAVPAMFGAAIVAGMVGKYTL